MPQQGTSGIPPEQEYHETVAPQNPPNSVVAPEVRRATLSTFLGGIIVVFVLAAGAFVYFTVIDKTNDAGAADPSAVGTSGERMPREGTPGGFDPAPSFDSTRDEIDSRGGASDSVKLEGVEVELAALPAVPRLVIGGGLDRLFPEPDSERLAEWLGAEYQPFGAHSHYGLVIGETSHVGRGKAAWLREVTDEVLRAGERGTVVDGICLYPVLDRPDWENASHWHRSGVWDLVPDERGGLSRVPCGPYLDELRRSRRRLGYPAAVGS